MPTLFLLLKGVLKFIFESAILFRKKEKEHEKHRKKYGKAGGSM